MVRGPESEMMGAVYKLRPGSVALAQQQVRFLISKTVGDYVFIILVFAKLLFLGQRIFPVGGREYQEYSVASLNIKNLMSPTPRNCVLNALILALKDSAEAFVSRRSK